VRESGLLAGLRHLMIFLLQRYDIRSSHICNERATLLEPLQVRLPHQDVLPERPSSRSREKVPAGG